MTYRVVFHAKADAETLGLPAEAFTVLIETLAAASRGFGLAATLATDDPRIRRAAFATFGLCSFHVDEATRALRVFDITWTG